MSSLPACTHILLDTALPELRQAWYRSSPHASSSEPLYLGTPFAHLGDISPIVASTSPHDPFLHWLMTERPSLNWGLLLESPATPGELAAHYRHWLTILNPQGNEVLFRFYDPDVLPHFLDAFDDREYRQWFGPADAVHCRTAETFITRRAEERPQAEAGTVAGGPLVEDECPPPASATTAIPPRADPRHPTAPAAGGRGLADAPGRSKHRSAGRRCHRPPDGAQRRYATRPRPRRPVRPAGDDRLLACGTT